MEQAKEVKCIICNRAVTKKDMEEGQVEMIKGPGYNNPGTTYNKKVFVCVCHEGVGEQVKKEQVNGS